MPRLGRTKTKLNLMWDERQSLASFTTCFGLCSSPDSQMSNVETPRKERSLANPTPSRALRFPTNEPVNSCRWTLLHHVAHLGNELPVTEKAGSKYFPIRPTDLVSERKDVWHGDSHSAYSARCCCQIQALRSSSRCSKHGVRFRELNGEKGAEDTVEWFSRTTKYEK